MVIGVCSCGFTRVGRERGRSAPVELFVFFLWNAGHLDVVAGVSRRRAYCRCCHDTWVISRSTVIPWGSCIASLVPCLPLASIADSLFVGCFCRFRFLLFL